MLYEPPIHLGTEHYSPKVLGKLQTLLDEGDPEGALITFQREIVHIPPHELALLRSSPGWPARIAAVPTVLRELRGANAYVFEATRFRLVRMLEAYEEAERETVLGTLHIQSTRRISLEEREHGEIMKFTFPEASFTKNSLLLKIQFAQEPN